jgi:hypothetical protein
MQSCTFYVYDISTVVIIDSAGACEYGNELSGSIKLGEFLD